jgi:hypothetical protein
MVCLKLYDHRTGLEVNNPKVAIRRRTRRGRGREEEEEEKDEVEEKNSV